MNLKAITLATSLALASTPAMADPGDWSSDRFDVTALDETCVMTSTFSYSGRADVELRVFAQRDDTMLLISSPPWSVVHAQKYDDFVIRFFGPDDAYSGLVTGYVNSGANGFSARLPNTFLDALARSRRLVVFRLSAENEDPTIVSDFNLVGSGAAVTALKRCLSTVLARNEAQRRREARFDHIARDPFANAPPSAPATTAPTVVTWSRAPRPDFPARAKERGITTATVKLSCTAAANGAAENCSIVSENPPGAGFGREALNSMRSSRFSPTVADAGGQREFTVDFSLD